MNIHNAVNYIYLLQEREFTKTNENIYKVGMTKQKNFKRFYQYPKGSILLHQMICGDASYFERKILKIFKNEFIHRKDIGNEYFECKNFNEMIDIIHSTIRNGKNDNPIIYNYQRIDTIIIIDDTDNPIIDNIIIIDNTIINDTIIDDTIIDDTIIDNPIIDNTIIDNTIIDNPIIDNLIIDNPKKLVNYSCDLCNYNTRKKYNYEKHMSSQKHLEIVKNAYSTLEYKYNCIECNYHTNIRFSYDKHKMSSKHKNNSCDYENNKEKEPEKLQPQTYNINKVVSSEQMSSLKNEIFVSIMGEIKTMITNNNNNNHTSNNQYGGVS